MRARYFTPDEANSLIEKVRGPMVQIRAAVRELQELSEVLSADDEARPILTDEQRVSALERSCTLRRQVQSLVEEVIRVGAEVKDLEVGLVDFPALKEGQEVCLCWRIGEREITHWHGVHEGFQARKPLSTVASSDWMWFS